MKYFKYTLWKYETSGFALTFNILLYIYIRRRIDSFAYYSYGGGVSWNNERGV